MNGRRNDGLDAVLRSARTDEPGFPLDPAFVRRTAAAMATIPPPRARDVRLVAATWATGAAAALFAIVALGALIALAPGAAEGVRAAAGEVAWVRLDILAAVTVTAVLAELFARTVASEAKKAVP